MTKRVVQCRNARIVPATSIWPRHDKVDDVVMLAELVSEHPVLGGPSERGDNSIRTSLIINQDMANRRIETLNTIYEVVA